MKTIHMDSLRMAINPAWKNKIPPNESGAYDNIPAVSQWGREHLGFFDVLVTKSSTIGSTKGRNGYGRIGESRPRNWLGTGKHRIHIVCPECSRLIPAGRLAQHYGYKHDKPEVERLAIEEAYERQDESAWHDSMKPE